MLLYPYFLICFVLFSTVQLSLMQIVKFVWIPYLFKLFKHKGYLSTSSSKHISPEAIDHMMITLQKDA